MNSTTPAELVVGAVLHQAALGGSTTSLLQLVAVDALRACAAVATAVVLGSEEAGFAVHAAATAVGTTVTPEVLLTGPVLVTSTTGAMCTVEDLAAPDQRWGPHAAAARAAGARGVRCWPVRVASRPVGALVVLTSDRWSAVPRSSAAGQALADVCAVALQLPPDEQRWSRVALHLGSALAVDVVVHQAAGMVAASHGVGVAVALASLTARAHVLAVPVEALARDVVARVLPAADVPPTGTGSSGA